MFAYVYYWNNVCCQANCRGSLVSMKDFNDMHIFRGPFMQTDIMMCDLIWPKSLGMGVCILTWTCAPLSLWILSHLHRLKARRMLGRKLRQNGVSWLACIYQFLSGFSVTKSCSSTWDAPNKLASLGHWGLDRKCGIFLGSEELEKFQYTQTLALFVTWHRVLRHLSNSFYSCKTCSWQIREDVDLLTKSWVWNCMAFKRNSKLTCAWPAHKGHFGITCPTETSRILKLFDRSSGSKVWLDVTRREHQGLNRLNLSNLTASYCFKTHSGAVACWGFDGERSRFAINFNGSPFCYIWLIWLIWRWIMLALTQVDEWRYDVVWCQFCLSPAVSAPTMSPPWSEGFDSAQSVGSLTNPVRSCLFAATAGLCIGSIVLNQQLSTCICHLSNLTAFITRNGTCCDKRTLSLKGSFFPYPYHPYHHHTYLFHSISIHPWFTCVCTFLWQPYKYTCVFLYLRRWNVPRGMLCGHFRLHHSEFQWVDLQAITILLVRLRRFRIPLMLISA